MAPQASIRESRLASIVDRFMPGTGGGGRLLVLGSLVSTLVSAAGSILAYGAVSGRMRIHWTLGAGPHYGPEFAPAALVLAVFPVLVAGVALGAYALDSLLRHDETFALVRPYYALSIVGTLTVLLIAQGALVVANL